MAFIEIIRKAFLAGFGIQEKVRELIDDLVNKGNLSESQAAKLFKEITERAEKSTEEFTKSISDAVGKSWEKVNIASKEDINQINKKIQSLSSRVKNLEETIEKRGQEDT